MIQTDSRAWLCRQLSCKHLIQEWYTLPLDSHQVAQLVLLPVYQLNQSGTTRIKPEFVGSAGHGMGQKGGYWEGKRTSCSCGAELGRAAADLGSEVQQLFVKRAEEECENWE